MAALFFIGNNGTTGSEPFRILPGGVPQLFADTVPGGGSTTGNGTPFAEVNGHIYMTVGNGTNVDNVYDITSGTPVQLTNFTAHPTNSSGASRVMEFNGQPYVIYTPPAVSPFTPPSLYSLASGTAALVGSLSGNVGHSIYPQAFTELGGRLYYFAWTGSGSNPYQLWSIGTSGDATLVPGAPSDLRGLGTVNYMVEFNNALYFVGTTAATGAELYKVSNGIVSLVSEINTGNGGSFDSSFWMSASTTVEFNGELYFPARSTANGIELYKITATGTIQSLGDLNPGIPGFNPNLGNAKVINGELLFAAETAASGFELWKIKADGSVVQVADIEPGTTGSGPNPSYFMEFNGDLYFSADTTSHGRELWKYGSASGGVSRVTDLNIDGGDSNPVPVAVYNNALYFKATTAGQGDELWRVKANGSVELVADISPGSEGSFTNYFTQFDGKLYFRAFTAANGAEVWAIDQTGVATMYEIAPGTTSGIQGPFTVLGTNANTAPTNIMLSKSTVREFAATGTDVGVLSATDAQGGAMTYALLNSAGGRFKLNGNILEVDNGLLSDFEQDATHVVRIRVTDSGGLTYIKNLTITLTDVATENITGDNAANVFVAGNGNDRLRGGGGSDRLTGGDGNDILDGGALNDVMIGGNGNDTYYVNHTGDVTTETNASVAVGGNDLVNATVSLTLAANIERLTLIGSAGIDATGNTRANTITGNGGDNDINGLAGNDLLTGGLGSDRFVFDTALNAATNKDRITDFDAAQDLILLDNAVFVKLVQAANTPLLAAYYWESANGLAHDGNDRILYNTTTGELSYDADGNKAGGVAAITFAVLTGAPNISQLDFLVV